MNYSELKKFDFSPLVCFTTKANDLMWYFEEGMFAYLIRCETQVIYDVTLVYLEFDCSAYVEYNQQYERMIYYNDDKTEQKTATESGLQRTKDWAYFNLNTDFTEWFHVLNGKFWDLYKKSNTYLNYLSWLENRLETLYNQKNEKESP